MTLILRKILASSTYAISGTLDGLANKLDIATKISEEVLAPPEELKTDIEELAEIEEEWEEDEEESPERKKVYTQAELAELRSEMATLQEFHNLAKAIVRNSKGEVLLTAHSTQKRFYSRPGSKHKKRRVRIRYRENRSFLRNHAGHKIISFAVLRIQNSAEKPFCLMALIMIHIYWLFIRSGFAKTKAPKNYQLTNSR